MTPRTHSDSIVVARPPHEVYELVADITRMGEYSPICKECWWDEGDGPRVGAHFTGRNVLPERTWETRSEVVAADPGREFAWVVGAAHRPVGLHVHARRRGHARSRSRGSSCPGGATHVRRALR